MTGKLLKRPLGAGLGAAALTVALWAQGPITDKVVVNFSSPVMVGNNLLPPGDYRIRQIPSAANPRILEFSSDNGMNVQATVTAIAAVDQLNRRPTTVEVEHGQGTAYVKRVWVEGQSYGYELLPPSNGGSGLEARNTRGMRITGTYTPENQQVAQARTTPEETARPEPTPAPVETPRTTPQETTTRQSTATDTTNQQTTTATTTPSDTNRNDTNRSDNTDAAAQTRTPSTTTTDQNTGEVPSLSGRTPGETTADTGARRRMPSTASGWPATMMAGVLLAGAGLLIGRIRK